MINIAQQQAMNFYIKEVSVISKADHPKKVAIINDKGYGENHNTIIRNI